MKFFFQFLSFIISVTILAVLNIASSYILPYPLSSINIILAILILVILSKNNGIVVWVSFASFFIIELFSVTPFGVILFSGTICILFSIWLYRHLFDNHAWYTAIILTIITLFIYNFIYVMALYILKISNGIEMIPWKFIFIIFFWESLFTVLFVLVGYIILWKFAKIDRPSLAESHIFRINHGHHL